MLPDNTAVVTNVLYKIKKKNILIFTQKWIGIKQQDVASKISEDSNVSFKPLI